MYPLALLQNQSLECDERIVWSSSFGLRAQEDDDLIESTRLCLCCHKIMVGIFLPQEFIDDNIDRIAQQCNLSLSAICGVSVGWVLRHCSSIFIVYYVIM